MLPREDALARTNYSFKKRQKELERKNKQEKKRLRRMNKNTPQPEENAGAPHDEAAESSAFRESDLEKAHPGDSIPNP
jgi:hypothetical protein